MLTRAGDVIGSRAGEDMFRRPIYRSSLALLTLAAIAGAAWLIVSPGGTPGIEITMPSVAPAAERDDGAAPPAGAAQLVDINAASPIELAEALPGIGPVLSERIIAYREANGPYVRTDQLMAVAGIGSATYERLRLLITVRE